MLKQALEKLQEAVKMQDMPVAGDTRTRQGREGLRRQYQAAIPTLREDFLKDFRRVAFPVFLTGTGTVQFQELAAENTESVNVSFRASTAAIRDAVRVNLTRDREFSPHGFAAMVREFRQLGADLGLTSIPTPEYDGAVVCRDEKELNDLVDTYIFKYLGTEFVVKALETQATRGAENLTCANPVIPVVITDFPTDKVAVTGPSLFAGKYLEVNAPATTDQDFVIGVFKSIKKAVKQ